VSENAENGRRRWLGVRAAGGLLLAGSAVPLPPDRTRRSRPYGPDALFHLAAHAGLAATLAAALEDGGPPGQVAARAVVVSTVYGVATELLQEGVSGRAFERGDVLAGLVGSLLGVTVTRVRGPRPREPCRW
jgi:VanZ family protein